MAGVMAVYANKGDVLNTERMLERHLTSTLRHYHPWLA
jgi:hypothetical protein